MPFFRDMVQSVKLGYGLFQVLQRENKARVRKMTCDNQLYLLSSYSVLLLKVHVAQTTLFNWIPIQIVHCFHMHFLKIKYKKHFYPLKYCKSY